MHSLPSPLIHRLATAHHPGALDPFLIDPIADGRQPPVWRADRTIDLPADSAERVASLLVAELDGVRGLARQTLAPHHLVAVLGQGGPHHRIQAVGSSARMRIVEMCPGYLERIDAPDDHTPGPISNDSARKAMHRIGRALGWLPLARGEALAMGYQPRQLHRGQRWGTFWLVTAEAVQALEQVAGTLPDPVQRRARAGAAFTVELRRPLGNASQRTRCPCGAHRNGDSRPSLVVGRRVAKCMVTGAVYRTLDVTGRVATLAPTGRWAGLQCAQGAHHNTCNHRAGAGAPAASSAVPGGHVSTLDGRRIRRVRSIASALVWSERMAASTGAAGRARDLAAQLGSMDRDAAWQLAQRRAGVTLARQTVATRREIPGVGSIPESWRAVHQDLVVVRLYGLAGDVDPGRWRAAVQAVVHADPMLAGEAAAVETAPGEVEVTVRLAHAVGPGWFAEARWRDWYQALGEALLAAAGVPGEVDALAFGPDGVAHRPAHRVVLVEDDLGAWSATVFRARLLFVQFDRIGWFAGRTLWALPVHHTRGTVAPGAGLSGLPST